MGDDSLSPILLGMLSPCYNILLGHRIYRYAATETNSVVAVETAL